MFALKKSAARQSARRQINLRGVRDGILLLPKHQYRLVLEVTAVNFELKSEDEQDALIDTYQSFLNSLPSPLQVLVRIRELDMDHYLADLAKRTEREAEHVYQRQLQQYRSFVSRLVASNRILSRHFYIVLPYEGATEDFETAKEQLALNADLIAKGLMRLGLHTRQLSILELLDLFHSFYNPVRAKYQPMSEQVARLLHSGYTAGEKR